MAGNCLIKDMGDVRNILYGEVIEINDNGVYVLVDNHFPRTFVEIRKDQVLEIFRKYILEDDMFKEKVTEIVAEFFNNIPDIDPETVPM